MTSAALIASRSGSGRTLGRPCPLLLQSACRSHQAPVLGQDYAYAWKNQHQDVNLLAELFLLPCACVCFYGSFVVLTVADIAWD